MICTNLRDAKASLNRLVDRAIEGDDVVLMRGSKPVAAIIRISEEDMNLTLPIHDAVATKIWNLVAKERASKQLKVFGSADKAVAELGK